MATGSGFARLVALTLAGGLALAGCQRDAATPDADVDPLASPTGAVRTLTRHLAGNELGAFARDALPPALHAQVEAGWRDGRTRWPLDQLPFPDRLPQLMAALSADDAERSLQQTFDRQFAHADLVSAADFLTVFTAQFIAQQGEFSDNERQHYPQLVQAVGAWAKTAPLNDRARAATAIATLSSAAREAGLASAEAFAEAGMQDGLRRMSPVVAAVKRVFASYGLALDGDLRDMRVELRSQTGDTAQVRMQYAVAGTPIDTVVDMTRHDGRWYVADFVGHATRAVGPEQAPAPAER